MSAATTNEAMTQIGEADLRRFVVRTALLSLIDPVRGAPTRTSFHESLDGGISGSQQLKQRFLESFALICSTSRSGAETASAVGLEQHGTTGTILRVARNRGLTPEDLTGLQGVLQILQMVARKEKPPAKAKAEILDLAVQLDRDRILSISERVEKRGIQNIVREMRSKLHSGQVQKTTFTNSGFQAWLESCPFTAASPRAWSHATMTRLIDWASKARWRYSEQLQSLLGLNHTQLPPWLDSLHKIARYYSATRDMVELAAKDPEVFAKIQIRHLKAPNPRQFSLSKSFHLLGAIKNLVERDSGMIMEKLEKHLGTQDVEARLRRACRLNLTLHAEMQLVVFYEGNPSLVPRMLFIGTSKKACFLCHEYLRQHPLRLQVSACHQKIYPTWMPPPYYPPTGQTKNLSFMRLSREIEKLSKRDLRDALTAPRRQNNQDSTAGPSVTITTSAPAGRGLLQAESVQLTLKSDRLSEYLE